MSDPENGDLFENPEPESDSLVPVDNGDLPDEEADERAEGDIESADGQVTVDGQEADERAEGDIDAANGNLTINGEGDGHLVNTSKIPENSDSQEVGIPSIGESDGSINRDTDLVENASDTDDKAEDELGLEYIREGQVTGIISSEDQPCEAVCSNIEQTEADACYASQTMQYSTETNTLPGKDEIDLNVTPVVAVNNSELNCSGANASLQIIETESVDTSQQGVVCVEMSSVDENQDTVTVLTTEKTTKEAGSVHSNAEHITEEVETNHSAVTCQSSKTESIQNSKSCDEQVENSSDIQNSRNSQMELMLNIQSDDSSDFKCDGSVEPVQVLSPSDSVESHEPECDQDVDNISDADDEVGCDSMPVTLPSVELCSNHCDSEGVRSDTLGPSETCSAVSKATDDQNMTNTSCVHNNCESINVVCSHDNKAQRSNPENAEVVVTCSISNSPSKSISSNSGELITSSPSSDDDLLSELESELIHHDSNHASTVVSNETVSFKSVNGFGDLDEKVLKQFQDQQSQLKTACAKLKDQEEEILRLKAENDERQNYCKVLLNERDSYLQQIRRLKSHNSDDLYLPQIKELEYTISQQQTEIKSLKDKLSSHDAAAKRAVATLQNELKMRIEQASKMQEEVNREKDTMVVKYAQAEKKFLEGQKAIERFEMKLREANRERENLTSRLRDAKSDLKKTTTEIESKNSELSECSKDLEKHKEMISSADVRIKWAQNKLKAELEGHKDTKTELEKTKMKLKDAKEETEQIRKDCQAIVKTYQESEEIKSNALDSQLKVKESEFLQQKQEKTDQEEIFHATLKELEHLKTKHRETITEVQTFKDKSQCLENERIQTEQTMNRFKEMLQKQKKDNKDLQVKVEEFVQVKSDFKRAQCTIKSLDAEISELKISNKDLLIEMESCRKRESEKLELTEKLSAKNAELQSENSNLQNQCSTQASEVAMLRMELQSLESTYNDMSDSLKQEQSLRLEETTQLKDKLEEKTRSVEELTVRIEDEKNDIKTLKRKHGNNIKDLTRQLQQVRKKLETFESNGDTQKDCVSMGSRTSSNGSLNTLCTSENNISSSINYQTSAPSSRFTNPPEQIQEYPLITEQVEPDKQVLIERIVKLQKGHARKNEKIEFMDDHIHQLIDEIQRKNKIIQSYAMREEAGTLTPETMDINKAQLSKKHSIMGSVYSSHQTDSGMTLDLSLEINRKLQAVLEDTLLKNITLKESLDTLGEEIARLSQENRQLQLQIQGKKQKR